MTEPPHLRAVPPSPSLSRSEDHLLSEQQAAHIHRQVHERMAPLRREALFCDALRVAADWLEPSRHRDLTPEQWDAAAHAKAGDVSRHVFDASLIGSPRSLHLARKEIARLVGLYLVLDHVLAGLEGDDGDEAG